VAALDLVASHFIAFPAAAYVLGELRSMGIPQAILTFGYASVEHRKAAQLDFSGQILVGEDLGIACGTPAAFAALARALSLPADRIWFVGGAGGLDLASARAAGCRTVLVDANATISQAATRVAEFTIDSLADLLPLLGEPYTRSLLAMRYMLRTVMTWRPGHFVAAPVDPSKS
jgi:FMN phosphatase YigB (HAD superfamily)